MLWTCSGSATMTDRWYVGSVVQTLVMKSPRQHCYWNMESKRHWRLCVPNKFSDVLTLMRTLLNYYLIKKKKFKFFSLFEWFWGNFDQNKAPQNSQRGQKIWNIFFWSFNIHMHPFKPLLDLSTKFQVFSLFESFWGHFDPKKALEIVKRVQKSEIFFSDVSTFICTLLNRYLIILNNF